MFQRRQRPNVHPKSIEEMALTIYLPLLVFLDMIGVTLVIPLLQQYLRDAGIVHSTQRELLNSVYSIAQILGGLTLGALNDTGILSPLQTLTYLSFLGSALSYALLAYSIHSKSLILLISSRVVVGVVKQTVTMTTSIASKLTSPRERSKSLGRLSVARTLAGILGPSFGALLYQHVGRSVPVWMASFIFICNFFLAEILLSKINDSHPTLSFHDYKNDPYRSIRRSEILPSKLRSNAASLMNCLNSCFQSKALSSVILSSLLYHFISSTTSYSNMTSYYEEMYGIRSYQRGYLSSYQSIWTLIVQTFVIHPLLIKLGGEPCATCAAAALIMMVTFLEMKSSLVIFLLFICPILAISTSLLSLSIKTLVTHVSPTASLSSVLAALDVLTNAVAVMVPFYRAMLFRFLGCFKRVEGSTVCIQGDPAPSLWLLSSALHWMLTSIIIYFLLVRNRTVHKKVK